MVLYVVTIRQILVRIDQEIKKHKNIFFLKKDRSRNKVAK